MVTRAPWLRRAALWAVVAALLAAGLALRFYDLDDLPLDFHPTRQLHSMLMARGLYLAQAPNVPDWQRERSGQQARAEGVIEPPIMEGLAVALYRLAGAEQPILPRAASVLFWTAGALGVYLLAREFFAPPAALTALGVMLVLPYGVYASRSFQPDPLMTALIVWSWWACARWTHSRSWRAALAAGLLGGAALLVKGTALFWVAPAYLGALLAVRYPRLLRSPQVWAAAGLAVLPYALYSLWGWFGAGFLQQQMGMRFFPQYWLDPVFYLRWFNLLDGAFGLPALALGLLGALSLPAGRARGLGWGAWAGYLLMGLALSHHVGTHDYYSLPLVPLIAFGAAALAQVLFAALPAPRRLTGALVGLTLLAALVMLGYQARTVLKRTDYRPQAAFWHSLTQRLGVNASVVGITEDYGARMAYWGWITPANWLTAAEFDLRHLTGDSFDLPALFDSMTAGKQVFLVTLPEELDRQPELKALLDARYPVEACGEHCLLYDLQNPLPGELP